MFVVDGRAPAQAELQFLDKQLEIGGKGGGEQQAKRRETKRNETKRSELVATTTVGVAGSLRSQA
tara:strand:- start:243 stop:437 length:195 start_codon:yes stop_codon:yes gene_type:complete